MLTAPLGPEKAVHLPQTFNIHELSAATESGEAARAVQSSLIYL